LILVALSVPGVLSFENSRAAHKRSFVMAALGELVPALGLVELMHVGWARTT